MNLATFQQVVKMAFSDKDLSDANIDPLYGCGLPDFRGATVTMEAAARHVRWQCQNLDGSVDDLEMDECRRAFGRKVQVVRIEAGSVTS